MDGGGTAVRERDMMHEMTGDLVEDTQGGEKEIRVRYSLVILLMSNKTYHKNLFTEPM